MKLVVTSDTHFPTDPNRIPDGDVFIHCGDLMYSGYVDEWQSRVDWLAALPHKTKLLVPGNHDFHIQNYEGIARAELRRQAKVRVVLLEDGLTKLPNGMMMRGIQYVTGLKGWAYCVAEEWLEDKFRSITQHDYGNANIIVSHAPVYGTLDACMPERTAFYAQEHVGGLAMHRWFNGLETKPSHWFCGHIHESYGRVVNEGCEFFNVAMCDRAYNQSNEPVVIDLED